ncbi:MAG TPA: chaperone NapD, partial [Desulfurivibrionaceae bacterium]|nr:chaperone NapD [Desulfurivibrionaceae bacterium]
MAIASVIVATEAGAADAVAADLNSLPNTTVYGSTDDEIVTVIEAETVAALSDGLLRLSSVERVVG